MKLDGVKMNIVYYTHLQGKKSAGLTYSIPAQVRAQSRIDNVYWFNCSDSELDTWRQVEVFHNKSDVSSCKISDFPKPFNKPDVVVFQSFYSPNDCFTARYLRANKIPYIIVPRGALTKGAQAMKKVKKSIANIMLFNNYAKKAAAVHYLTKQEYADSGEKWNGNSFVIPNGIEPKRVTKTWTKSNSLRGVFIGRLDIYHKGIDLLIQACENNYRIMKEKNCTIDIYGPSSSDSDTIENMITQAGLNGIINLKDAVYGEAKEEVLLNSDFFVLTSRFEGHPMGLIEALSYGLPCLVTTGTNMAQEVKDADAGWTSDISVEGLSEALKSLLREKGNRGEKGKNSLNLSNKYKWENIAQKTHDEYKAVLGVQNNNRDI